MGDTEAGGAGAISIERVTRRFGARVAVDGCDLAIGAGEFFSLLGGSGCGKTTLLRMVAGFELPDEGRIAIDGRDMAALPPHRRPVNMMFQNYALFPHLSAIDNVAFGLRRAGVAKRAAAARAGAMLDMVQMRDLADRRPHRLSGGQQQRVALARALIRQPRVLLLDEPLSALDRKLRGETALELVRLQRALGTTFVMVTHDQEEAMSVSTRLAVMDRGRIVQVGTPEEVYERPSDAFVAGFVGAMNLFSGTGWRVEGSRLSLSPAGLDATLVVPVEPGTMLPAAGETVRIGVRPERIRLGAPDAAAPGENRVAGSVLSVAYLGARRTCEVRLADGMVARVAMPADAPAPRVGEAVALSWDAERGRLLA